MTDHIVVFDGAERLVGQSIRVHIDDASSFTLYGRVVTTGFASAPISAPILDVEESPSYPAPLDYTPPNEEPKRIGLPVV